LILPKVVPLNGNEYEGAILSKGSPCPIKVKSIIYFMEQPKSYSEKTKAGKSLAYTKDFKEWIKSHLGVIAVFKKLSKELIEVPNPEVNLLGKVFQEGPITATVIKAYTWDKKTWIYFKLEIDGETFFVKSEGVPYRGKGYEEFKNTQRVIDRLKEVEGVEVVNPQLGYQDKSGRTYFISKWVDLPLLKNYIKNLQKEDSDSEEYLKLRDRVRSIQGMLPEFHDIADWNMFYDKNTGKIILFDLFTTPQDLILNSASDIENIFRIEI